MTGVFTFGMWLGMANLACIDLFCGAGGLTHGFVQEGLHVTAGIDLDPACQYPYEANNQAKFLERDVSKLASSELMDLFGGAKLKILAGCAPCQPFSTYAQRYESDGKNGRWAFKIISTTYHPHEARKGWPSWPHFMEVS